MPEFGKLKCRTSCQLFGAADRRLLFRVGAGALLVIAIAFWIWLMRSAEEDRVFLTFTIVGGWIGATAGIWAAALDSGKPDTSSSWPPPAGSESGDKIQNYCFGCGSLLAAGIAICPSCGVPTQTAQPPSPVAPTTTS